MYYSGAQVVTDVCTKQYTWNGRGISGRPLPAESCRISRSTHALAQIWALLESRLSRPYMYFQAPFLRYAYEDGCTNNEDVSTVTLCEARQNIKIIEIEWSFITLLHCRMLYQYYGCQCVLVDTALVCRPSVGYWRFFFSSLVSAHGWK